METLSTLLYALAGFVVGTILGTVFWVTVIQVRTLFLPEGWDRDYDKAFVRAFWETVGRPFKRCWEFMKKLFK